MSERICFNQNAFLIGMILITVVVLIFNQHFGNKECPPCKPIIIHNQESKKTIKKEVDPIVKLGKSIKRRDVDALHDDLSAPTRRLPRHLYPSQPNDFIKEVHTRGEPDQYHQLGNMIRQSDERIVKFFGRQIYPGSNQYEYYGITTDANGAEIKIPIKVTNDKEIYDGDEIDIEFLDPANTKGKFKLYMNEFDRPRYNPYTHRY
jgi:hypothetical protein